MSHAKLCLSALLLPVLLFTGCSKEASQAPASKEQAITVAETSPQASESSANQIDDEYEITLLNLQSALKNNDKRVIATMVSYPFTTPLNDNKTIENAQGFLEVFDKIMTPQIQKVILEQKYQDVFTNQNGMMLGKGEVWISGVCSDNACKQSKVLITAIQNPR